MMILHPDVSARRTLSTGLILTLASSCIALPHLADAADLLPAMQILLPWALVVAVLTVVNFARCMYVTREKRPIAAISDKLAREPVSALFFPAILMLAGINLIAFMWVKPALNAAVPFWAGPHLAELDTVLFFGNDPWTVLPSAPSAAFAIYHPLWLLNLMLTLAVTAAAPSDPKRTATLISYFALWSIGAPLVHTLLPAGGPIFFERLGYGPRYAAMPIQPEMAAVSDYLWSNYTTLTFNTGAGISAMPSMHVTMSAWAALALSNHAPRLAALGWGAYAMIFYLSIALGWHFAVDGIVGTGLAFVSYRLTLRWATWAEARTRVTSKEIFAPA